jgi:diacylglycerol kinase family enzyme
MGSARRKVFVDRPEAAGIDLVLNCNARRLGDGGPLRASLVGEAHRLGARVHETRSLPELERVASAIAARGSRAVVLAGGDGSHMGGRSALARTFGAEELPPVALAPGGTVCTVARNFGLRGGDVAWSERLLRAVCEGRARTERRPTLRVRDDEGVDRVGFIFGAGLVARFFEAYYSAPRQGLGAAGALAARLAAGALVGSTLARSVLATTACTLSVDGEAGAAEQWSLVLASVVRDVGLHILATYRAGERDDRFHVVASGLSPAGLAREVPRVLAGRTMRGEPRLDALARSLDVSFAARNAYVLDGDLLHGHTARVEAGPVIDLLLPE